MKMYRDDHFLCFVTWALPFSALSPRLSFSLCEDARQIDIEDHPLVKTPPCMFYFTMVSLGYNALNIHYLPLYSLRYIILDDGFCHDLLQWSCPFFYHNIITTTQCIVTACQSPDTFMSSHI
jgi:hypothetical protein